MKPYFDRFHLEHVVHVDKLGLEASAMHFTGDQDLLYAASLEKRSHLYGGREVDRLTTNLAYGRPIRTTKITHTLNRVGVSYQLHVQKLIHAINSSSSTGGVYQDLTTAITELSHFRNPVWVDIVDRFLVWPFCLGLHSGFQLMKKRNTIRLLIDGHYRVEVAPQVAHFCEAPNFRHDARRFSATAGAPFRVFGAMTKDSEKFYIKPYLISTSFEAT